MNIVFDKVCDTGFKREINQDAVFAAARRDEALFCVADGMGGHSRGEVASGIIVSHIEDWWNATIDADLSFISVVTDIKNCIESANKEIRSNLMENEICGSTVVVLYICNDKYAVFSAGDSRIYMANKWKSCRLTTDEVWENQSYLNLTDEEKMNNPNRGKLVNAVGMADTLRIRVRTDEIKADSSFLLCSDGLYKYCDEKIIMKTISNACEDGIENAINCLYDEVKGNGAGDNVSLIVVDAFI